MLWLNVNKRKNCVSTQLSSNKYVHITNRVPSFEYMTDFCKSRSKFRVHDCCLNTGVIFAEDFAYQYHFLILLVERLVLGWFHCIRHVTSFLNGNYILVFIL